MSLIALKNLYSISGGDAKKEHIGYGKMIKYYIVKDGVIERTEVIGDKLKRKLTELNLEFHSFIKNYWTKIGIKEEHTRHFLDMFIKIFGYEFGSLAEVKEFLTELITCNIDSIVNILCRLFYLYEPVVEMLRHIFMAWKAHLEKLFKIYMDKRNKYIDANSTSDIKNSIEEYEHAINKINIAFGNGISSPFLMFLHEPNIKNIPWMNDNMKQKFDGMHYPIIEIHNNPASAILASKLADIDYPGFCPKAPVQRLTKLLEFPFTEVLETIVDISNANEYLGSNYGIISEKLGSPETPLEHYEQAEAKKKEVDNNVPDIDVTKACKNYDTLLQWEKDVIQARYLMEKFLIRLNAIKPVLILKEKYYIHLAEHLVKVNNILVKNLAI